MRFIDLAWVDSETYQVEVGDVGRVVGTVDDGTHIIEMEGGTAYVTVDDVRGVVEPVTDGVEGGEPPTTPHPVAAQ